MTLIFDSAECADQPFTYLCFYICYNFLTPANENVGANRRCGFGGFLLVFCLLFNMAIVIALFVWIIVDYDPSVVFPWGSLGIATALLVFPVFGFCCAFWGAVLMCDAVYEGDKLRENIGMKCCPSCCTYPEECESKESLKARVGEEKYFSARMDQVFARNKAIASRKGWKNFVVGILFIVLLMMYILANLLFYVVSGAVSSNWSSVIWCPIYAGFALIFDSIIGIFLVYRGIVAVPSLKKVCCCREEEEEEEEEMKSAATAAVATAVHAVAPDIQLAAQAAVQGFAPEIEAASKAAAADWLAHNTVIVSAGGVAATTTVNPDPPAPGLMNPTVHGQAVPEPVMSTQPGRPQLTVVTQQPAMGVARQQLPGSASPVTIPESQVSERPELRGEIAFDFRPNTDREVSVDVGESVTVLVNSGLWSYILKESGEEGYVPSNFVELISKKEDRPSPNVDSI